MGAAKAFDGKPGVGPAENSTDGADENVHEKMVLVLILDAEVRAIAITIHQVLERGLRFGSGGLVGSRFHESARIQGTRNTLPPIISSGINALAVSFPNSPDCLTMCVVPGAL